MTPAPDDPSSAALRVDIGVAAGVDAPAAGPSTTDAGPEPTVTVTVTNVSLRPVVIAARLAMGYRASTERELYAVVTDPVSGDEVGIPAQLYQRGRLRADDLQVLAPGDQVGTAVRLDDWYDHPAGELDVRMVYDSNEAADQFPQVLRATVVSEPVRIPMSGTGWE